MSGSRDGAVAAALSFFDEGGFERRLGDLVAIRSTSQDPGHEADLHAYLAEITPWLERLGFTCATHDNPVARERADPAGRAARGDRADSDHVWARRYGARAGGSVGGRAGSVEADAAGGPLVRARLGG